MMNVTLVWFRRDLRLQDNPAWNFAIGRDGLVVPIYIHSPQEDEKWIPGKASLWWLHHSLQALKKDLKASGYELLLESGSSATVLLKWARKTGAKTVTFNRLYEPAMRDRDRLLEKELGQSGLSCHSFNGTLLFEPWEVLNGSGQAYRVFTPFYRKVLEQPWPEIKSVKPCCQKAKEWTSPFSISDFDMLPKIPWDVGFREVWQPGERGAQDVLHHFLENAGARYGELRDRPDESGTSRLSAALHFGELSPHRIWQNVQERIAASGRNDQSDSLRGFLRQVVWRDFAFHLLHHFPHTTEKPLSPKFSAFPWRRNKKFLTAWQRGLTGYPIVDAGMRELWHTGWMHNRVRMIVASFLVKDLLIPWQDGARWFWDTLVDADLANNTLGWQWVAGCGADAAPFFRIFNPTTQGQKFDPQGIYVKKWIPELRDVPVEFIHEPWRFDIAAPSYPQPIVDHATQRALALQLYRVVNGK